MLHANSPFKESQRIPRRNDPTPVGLEARSCTPYSSPRLIKLFAYFRLAFSEVIMQGVEVCADERMEKEGHGNHHHTKCDN